MRTVDFSPFFRSAIGFDRLFDLAEAAQRVGEESYPPTILNGLTRTAFKSRWRLLVSSLMKSS
jgi:molecular chaperone IbpA